MADETTSTLDILDERYIAFGDSIKALGDGKLGGYLVRFSDSDSPDLQGEYFTSDTDYDLENGERATVYYQHGFDPVLGKRKIGTGKMKQDDIGIWIDAQLNLRDKYERAIYAMAEANKSDWSSGSLMHLVEREPVNKAQWIKSWPIGKDATITPTPAAGLDKTSVMTLKAYKQMAETNPDFKALLPEDTQDSISEDAKDEADDANVSDSLAIEEDITMSETQDAPVLATDAIDAIAEAMGARMKEELEPVTKRLDALEKAQPVDDGGTDITVVKDADDNALEGNPFKSFGDFLQLLARGSRDKRLRAVKSSGDGMGGYYDVTKAMGNEFVGSMSATKAPTGLQEGIPSAGGFLVGTDRAAGLLGRVYNVGQLIQRTDMVGISSGSNGMTFYAEDETSRANGSRRGGIRAYWAAEAEEKTASEPKFREMELKLRKAIGLVYATDELLADASALESWIMQNLPEELSFVVEDAIINGSGVGLPLGILTSGATVSVAKETGQAAATIVAENISKMWARRWLGGRNYVWLYNQDVEPELDNLALAVGTGGSLVYMPPGGLSQAPYGSIKGVPAVPVEYCATLGTVGDLILADLSQYQMIDKGGVMSESSIHVRFIYDETVFRFVYRVDGQPKWDSALTPFKGTNTVSPFVTLATRA